VPEKIAELQSGHTPIHEPGLEELLARCGDRLSFTLDVADVVATVREADAGDEADVAGADYGELHGHKDEG